MDIHVDYAQTRDTHLNSFNIFKRQRCNPIRNSFFPPARESHFHAFHDTHAISTLSTIKHPRGGIRGRSTIQSFCLVGHLWTQSDTIPIFRSLSRGSHGSRFTKNQPSRSSPQRTSSTKGNKMEAGSESQFRHTRSPLRNFPPSLPPLPYVQKTQSSVRSTRPRRWSAGHTEIRSSDFTWSAFQTSGTHRRIERLKLVQDFVVPLGAKMEHSLQCSATDEQQRGPAEDSRDSAFE
jgi:hypothetical protein